MEKYMPKVDFEWVKSQLSRSKTRKKPGDVALELLKLWEKHEFPNEHQQEEAVKVFSALARGHALVLETDERWAPAQAGFMLTVGDTVRVRSDAFTGELGTMHNGRRGVIVAKRSGDIIVKHTDGLKPSRTDARYPASVLEKKV
jgi:hypothetical protein